MQFDLSKGKQLKCQNCGGTKFSMVSTYTLYKFSKIVTNTNKDEVVSVTNNDFVCINCNTKLQLEDESNDNSLITGAIS
jgi:DNA-directed RNA polymerase subunit RPC12/RpoP